MKSEEALNISIENPIFSAVTGSRLYGTNREDSDYDSRGYIIPPFEYLINVKKFECREFSDKDHKIYSLKRYLDLALKGDPQSIELLYIPENKIINTSDIANEFISLRSDIISENIQNRLIGYAYSEWRKAMGQRMLMDKRTVNEDNVINDIRNIFAPNKENMDNIIEILMEDKERKVISSKMGLGAKRKKEFEEYGFGTSSAVHSIRLLDQLYELMTTGVITFPRPNAELLKGIRYGEYTKNEVNEIYEENLCKVKNNKDNSILRKKPNYKKIWQIYSDVIKSFLK